MGMGIEENEIVVAKIIANDSKEVRPLAIRIKDFNVHSLIANEVEVSLERLKKQGVVKEYHHRWGFFIKKKGRRYILFEETGKDHPQFSDDGGQSGEEAEVYRIDFSPTELTQYLEQKRYDATPEGFAFSLKAPQSITHEKKMVGVAEDVKTFEHVIEE